MTYDITNKTILITGGTGSFGKKCTEILLKNWAPKKLIIFSRDELKQHDMRQQYDDSRLRFFIGDVRDRDRLYRAMNGVDIVIHAAALKQVPACEYNPFEAVKTNILGAVNIIDAAIDNQVSKVLALSTDKAVNPGNLYGATKMCAEKLFVQGNAYSGADGTQFSCARYGNVIASRGSVIPIFQEQRTTGVITVTDKRMGRFWITLEKGVDFVFASIERMLGGEIFIPKIPSMNIMDLAEAIAPGCEVRVTGVRGGEKIHELLLSPDEASQALEFPDMFVLQPSHPWWKEGSLNGGQPLPDGFSYSSHNNGTQLSIDELEKIVSDL